MVCAFLLLVCQLRQNFLKGGFLLGLVLVRTHLHSQFVYFLFDAPSKGLLVMFADQAPRTWYKTPIIYYSNEPYLLLKWTLGVVLTILHLIKVNSSEHFENHHRQRQKHPVCLIWKFQKLICKSAFVICAMFNAARNWRNELGAAPLTAQLSAIQGFSETLCGVRSALSLDQLIVDCVANWCTMHMQHAFCKAQTTRSTTNMIPLLKAAGFIKIVILVVFVVAHDWKIENT